MLNSFDLDGDWICPWWCAGFVLGGADKGGGQREMGGWPGLSWPSPPKPRAIPLPGLNSSGLDRALLQMGWALGLSLVDTPSWIKRVRPG